MLGRLFVAFLVGLAVAGGISWYLHSKPEPAAPITVAAAPAPVPEPEPAPAPAPKPEPKAPARKIAPLAPAPRPVAAPEPAPAPAPAPVEVAENRATPIPAAAEQPQMQLPLPAQREIQIAPPTAETTPILKPEPSKPAVPQTPRTVTIPAGTVITVRMNETLDSGRNEKDYTFRATLDAPLIVDNLVLAERGSTQLGRVVGVERAGRVGSSARLEVKLTRLTTSDGQTVDIDTDSYSKKAERSTEKKEVAKRAAVGAMIGAAIGAMAGGGVGAAIGAGAGGGAGAGSVVIRKGSEAVLSSETRISFRLKSPLTLTEKILN